MTPPVPKIPGIEKVTDIFTGSEAERAKKEERVKSVLKVRDELKALQQKMEADSDKESDDVESVSAEVQGVLAAYQEADSLHQKTVVPGWSTIRKSFEKLNKVEGVDTKELLTSLLSTSEQIERGKIDLSDLAKIVAAGELQDEQLELEAYLVASEADPVITAIDGAMKPINNMIRNVGGKNAEPIIAWFNAWARNFVTELLEWMNMPEEKTGNMRLTMEREAILALGKDAKEKKQREFFLSNRANTYYLGTQSGTMEDMWRARYTTWLAQGNARNEAGRPKLQGILKEVMDAGEKSKKPAEVAKDAKKPEAGTAASAPAPSAAPTSAPTVPPAPGYSDGI